MSSRMMISIWNAMCAWHDGELLVVGTILTCWLVIGLLVSCVCRSWYPFRVSFACVFFAMTGLIIMQFM